MLVNILAWLFIGIIVDAFSSWLEYKLEGETEISAFDLIIILLWPAQILALICIGFKTISRKKLKLVKNRR